MNHSINKRRKGLPIEWRLSTRSLFAVPLRRTDDRRGVNSSSTRWKKESRSPACLAKTEQSAGEFSAKQRWIGRESKQEIASSRNDNNTNNEYLEIVPIKGGERGSYKWMNEWMNRRRKAVQLWRRSCCCWFPFWILSYWWRILSKCLWMFE